MRRKRKKEGDAGPVILKGPWTKRRDADVVARIVAGARNVVRVLVWDAEAGAFVPLDLTRRKPG